MKIKTIFIILLFNAIVFPRSNKKTVIGVWKSGDREIHISDKQITLYALNGITMNYSKLKCKRSNCKFIFQKRTIVLKVMLITENEFQVLKPPKTLNEELTKQITFCKKGTKFKRITKAQSAFSDLLDLD